MTDKNTIILLATLAKALDEERRVNDGLNNLVHDLREQVEKLKELSTTKNEDVTADKPLYGGMVDLTDCKA
jgi:hypothetical protein